MEIQSDGILAISVLGARPKFVNCTNGRLFNKKKNVLTFSAQKVKKSSDSNIGVYTIEKCFESVIKSASFIEIPRKIYSFENPHVRLCSFCSDQRYRPDTAAGQFPGFLHQV